MKTLSVNYYFYVLKILEKMGVERHEIADIAPLDLEAMTHPYIRIEIDALNALLTYAESKLQNSQIGMSISHHFRISNYGYAGQVYPMCENIEHALSVSQKYGCLAHTLGAFAGPPIICRDTLTAKYVWVPSFASEDCHKYQQITEFILCNYVLTVNWLSWSFPKGVECVTFQHSPAGPKKEYDRLLSCKTKFVSSENAIVIDLDSLRSPLPTVNPVKFVQLEQKLNKKLALYNLEDNITNRTRNIVYDMIQHCPPTLGHVAQELSLTERTLKRHLKNSGTNFQEILRSVKMELSSIYMKEKIPYSEISQRLWYFDQSAFTRAYKKWYGYTPSRYQP